MGKVPGLQSAAAVRQGRFQSSAAKIGGTGAGIFQLHRIQAEAVPAGRTVHLHGAVAQFQQVVKVLLIGQRGAEIELSRSSVGKNFHQVTVVRIFQVEGPAFRMKQNRHKRILLEIKCFFVV